MRRRISRITTSTTSSNPIGKSWLNKLVSMNGTCTVNQCGVAGPDIWHERCTSMKSGRQLRSDSAEFIREICPQMFFPLWHGRLIKAGAFRSQVKTYARCRRGNPGHVPATWAPTKPRRQTTPASCGLLFWGGSIGCVWLSAQHNTGSLFVFFPQSISSRRLFLPLKYAR